MPDFLINVRSNWDASGVRSYANEVRAAIRQIEAAASGVRGRPVTGAALQGQVQSAQAQAHAGLESIAQSGVLSPEALTRLRTGIDAEFRRLSDVLRVQLAGAEQVQQQAQRANASSRSASTAQERADRNREERANREATRAAAEARRAAATTPEARLARQTETGQIRQRANVNARLIESQLAPLAEDESLAQAKDRLALFNREDRERRARLIQQLDQRIRTEEGIVELAAAELVSKRRFAGEQAESIARDRSQRDTLVDAQRRQQGLRGDVRGEAAVINQAAYEDRDPQRMARHQLRAEELAAEDVRRAQERADANRHLLANEQALSGIVESRVVAEQRRAATRTPAESAAAAEREARARERAARQAETETARKARAEAQEMAAIERTVRARQAEAAEATGIQRIQAAISRRTGREDRPPSSFPTGGQLLGSGLVTSARFAISGAALYGAVNTIQEMVREASELERIFNQVDAQFTSIGQAGEARGFREQILAIAQDTGTMADQVASVGFQMKGAFGEDTQAAVEATRAAIEIAKVTGLDLVEVVDSLTAAAKSFQVPIRSIGDEALAIQESFGVLAKESIKVFGDVGAVASQAGLSMHELGGIIGGLQQIAGRSGSALAEAIGRILPALQESAGEIMNLYQTVPELAQNFPKVRDLLGAGDTGAVLVQLIRDFKDLDATQQANIITQLGSRREAQTLIGILRQYGVILDYIDNRTQVTGKQTEYFNNLQDTLAQRTARLAREFEAFGQRLFNAGIGDVLKDIVTAGELVVRLASGLASGFATANEATGGLAVKLLELYAVFKLISGLRGLLGAEALTGILGFAQRGAQGAAAAPGGVLAGGASRYAGASLLAQMSGGVLGSSVGAGALAPGTRLGAARASASGGLAALGLTGPMVTAIAALAVGSKYLSERGDNDDVADRFRKSIEDASTERLNRIIENRGSLLDRIEEGVLRAFQFRTPISEARAERGQDRYAPIAQEAQAAREAGLVGRRDLGPSAGFFGGAFGTNREKLDDTYKKAAEGDEKAVAFLESELARIKRDPKTRAQLETRINALQAKIAADAEERRIVTGEALDGVHELELKYQAGLATIGQYASAVAAEIRKIEAQLPGLTGDARQTAEDQLAELRKTQSELPSVAAQGLANYRIGEIELRGGSPQEKARVLTNLLRDPNFTKPEDRVAAGKQLQQVEQEIFAAYVARATSAEDEVRRLTEGLPRSPESRIESLYQTIAAYDQAFTTYLVAVTGSAEQAAVLLRQAVERAIGKSISVGQAVTEIINEEIVKIRARLAQLGGVLAGPPDPNAPNDPVGESQRLARDLEDKLADLERANPGTTVPTPGDRYRGDQTQVDAAKERAARDAETRRKEAERAAEERRRAAIEAQRARLALRRVEAEGDPVAVAQAAVDEARYSISVAENEADRLNGMAALITAQRQLSQAHLSVRDAYRNIDKAMADAAGDAVRSAEIELESIREHIAEAEARGDKLAVAQGRAQLIAQQRAVDQAALATAQQDIDFYRELGQATLGQTIAAYEALLPLASKNKDDYQALLLKINALRKEGAQNLAFDVPAELTLPTLYEVRRSNQQASIGAGYQDNRVISVNFTANNVTDAQAIADQIVDGLAAPSRVGTVPKRY